MRYVIWGWALVFDPDGRVVNDREALRVLSDYVDDEDLYATDFLGGSDEEDALGAALERSGQLRFAMREREMTLRVFNEYVARRPLSPSELELLRRYTLGQWSDGMGECIFVPRGPYKDYKLQPLDDSEIEAPGYPFLQISKSPVAQGGAGGILRRGAGMIVRAVLACGRAARLWR